MSPSDLGLNSEAMLLSSDECLAFGAVVPLAVLEAQRNKVLSAIEDWVKERMSARYGWEHTRIHRDFVWARQDAGIERQE